MSRRKTPRTASPVETWPVIWRIVKLEPDGDASTVDVVTSEDFARHRTEELRQFGWPVRLERVALEPLPLGTSKTSTIYERLRKLHRGRGARDNR